MTWGAEVSGTGTLGTCPDLSDLCAPVFWTASAAADVRAESTRQGSGTRTGVHVPEPARAGRRSVRDAVLSCSSAPASEISGRPVRVFAADVDVRAEDLADVRGRDRRGRIPSAATAPFLRKISRPAWAAARLTLCSATTTVLPLSFSSPEEAVDLGLVADVEMAARLVEQEQGRVLGQGPGDEDALPFAAAQLGQELVRRIRRPRSAAWPRRRPRRPPAEEPSNRPCRAKRPILTISSTEYSKAGSAIWGT